MIKLCGVDCWSASRVSGIVDMGGSEYFNFLSEKGKEPVVYEDFPFFKKDYKNFHHFTGVVGKFAPYMVCANVPVKVRSLAYQDLIDVCREKFPGVKDIFK